MLIYFALTLFVSSTLLFLVQPMIGKMILPRLGGTPAVWNTCMVFFQAVLLVGYAYTHAVSTWQNRRRQLVMQLALLALPFLALPFALGDWQPPAEDNPVFAVLWLLLGLVGLPFFVVATSAPLLQKWFAGTGHPAAKDPYFLYGASNLGSMLALIIYPTLVEPNLSLENQSLLWTISYSALVALIAGCALLVWAPPTLMPRVESATSEPLSPVKELSAERQSTAIRAGRRPRKPAVQHAATATAPPASSAPFERQHVWLRVCGLSAIPLGVMLAVAKYLSPALLTEQRLLWGGLWVLYGVGLAAVLTKSPWRWAGVANTCLVCILPAVLVSLYILSLFHVREILTDPLPPWLDFLLTLTAILLPVCLAFPEKLSSATTATDQPTLARRLRWIGLSAAPSSLMLGVTTYLTTDIAAIPLFWVIPLALYLLTFILVFMRWPFQWTGLAHQVVLVLQPFALAVLVTLVVARPGNIPNWVVFMVHLASFFMTALMCHGELAKDRPATRHLTEFYLWMSVGGVLGGMFNALVAPPLFWFGIVEYPLAVLLAFLLRPWLVGETPLFPGDSHGSRIMQLGKALDLVMPVAIGLFSFVVLIVFRDPQEGVRLRLFLIIVAVFCCLALALRPLRGTLAFAAFMLAAFVFSRSAERLIHVERGFFGFLSIQEDGGFRTLFHGRINHGMQHLTPRLRRNLITYFFPTSGIGQAFQSLKWPDERLPASLVALGATPWGQVVGLHSEPPYAVVGLGIGTLAGHARPLQHLTFYEIDPAVVRLSLPEDGEAYFTYIQDAVDRGARVDMSLGDGRLQLRHKPDSTVDMYLADGKHPRKERTPREKYYHVLVLDAFSSDAIPVHLLTLEAVDLYLSKLADGGVLIFNTTNRFVDLRPVLADIAAARGLACLHYGDHTRGDIPDRYSSDWVILQRDPAKWQRDPATGQPRNNNAVAFSPSYNGGAPLPQRFFTSAAGTWQAQLDPNNEQASLSLLVYHNFTGWHAALEERPRASFGPEFTTTEIDGNKIRVEVVAHDMSFEGRLNADRSQLLGTYRAQGKSYDVVLTRRLEWEIPQSAGDRVWTDTYSNLWRVLELRGSHVD